MKKFKISFYLSDTPLILAAYYGHTEVVECLLQSGANLSATGEDQSTALHCAAQEGHPSTVSVLLGKGANPDSLDANGYVVWRPDSY